MLTMALSTGMRCPWTHRRSVVGELLKLQKPGDESQIQGHLHGGPGTFHYTRQPLGDVLCPPPTLHFQDSKKQGNWSTSEELLMTEVTPASHGPYRPQPICHTLLQPLELLTVIHEPGHAQGVEFLIKKLHPLQEKRR